LGSNNNKESRAYSPRKNQVKFLEVTILLIFDLEDLFFGGIDLSEIAPDHENIGRYPAADL
jgi:hypothetical protein